MLCRESERIESQTGKFQGVSMTRVVAVLLLAVTSAACCGPGYVRFDNGYGHRFNWGRGPTRCDSGNQSANWFGEGGGERQSGNYEATHLNPGIYSVAAQAAGFKKFEYRDIQLETLRSCASMFSWKWVTSRRR